MPKRSLNDRSGRWAQAIWRSSWRDDLVLLAVLSVLGALAAQLNVPIPHTPTYIEGRWAFGYMGFALLGRWWLALILALVLSTATPDPRAPMWVVVGGNLLYSLPCLVVIRLTYRRLLARRSLLVCGLGWVAVVMVCYQAFNTPLVGGVIAWLRRESFWSGMRSAWVAQDYLLESFLVSIVSALGVLVYRSHLHLLGSRRELAITLDSIGDGVIATDAEGRVQRLNPVAEQLTGWSMADAAGRPVEEVFSIVHAQTGQTVPSPVQRVLSEGTVVDLANDTCLVSRDGRRRQIADSAAPLRESDGRLMGVVMVFRDVTEEYAARQALRESDRRYRELFEGARDGFVMVDPAGRIIDANQAYCRLLGYDLDELRTMDDFYSVTPERWRQWEKEEIWENRLLKRGHSGVYEKEYIRRDGSVVPVELQAYAVRDPDGRLQYLWGVAREVTQRKQAEEALRESERRYRTLAENFPDGALFLFDRRFRYLAADGKAFTEVGLTSEGVVGRTVEEVFPDLWPTMRPYHEAVFRGEHVYYEVELNGRLYSNQGVPIADDRGEYDRAIVITQDITDRRRAERDRAALEAQLRQSQKLEAVGRLAGGVAHDFNNMLQTILGFSDMLLEQASPESPERDSLEQIRHAARRSADLTRQLLAFARKQTIAPKVLDLNNTVAGMLKMLHRLIGEDIELVWKPAANLWSVRMDPAQLDQVLANLVVNARDAIDGVGQVIIKTDRVEFDESDCLERSEAQPGPYVRLAVADTGSGMDDETIGQIFEPFYTTKPLDQGTGLGLATVYGIVHQNGGFINVYSEPGQGTTFHIYLPAASADPESDDRPPAEPRPTGRETILLVEDDAGVLRLGSRCLGSLGYRVLAAAGPAEALAVAESARTQGGIDLVLTDVIMPGMSGRDLWQELRQSDDSLRCLFMSGHPAEVIAHHGVLDADVQFIQKPFDAGELAVKVREVLDATAPSAGEG